MAEAGTRLTVYGPYLRKDGRKHVIHSNDGERVTQSYPRYLMEQHLGRKLEAWEEVDHINGDYTDDRIENYQILTKAENIRKSAVTKMFDFVCPTCGNESSIPYRRYKDNQIKQGKAGPYCSRSCAGKAHN